MLKIDLHFETRADLTASSAKQRSSRQQSMAGSNIWCEFTTHGISALPPNVTYCIKRYNRCSTFDALTCI